VGREPRSAPGGARVAFLFNAQDHQVPHALPVACELSRLLPPGSVTVIARTAAQTALCRRLAGFYLDHRLVFDVLDAPPGGLVGGWKALLLWWNRRRLNGYDALVVPERTSLMLRRMGVRRPAFIHLAHGPGGADRPDDPRLARFDLLLMPNADRLAAIRAAGNARPGRAAVIGGVKLDLVRRMAAADGPRLFANDRPTILYNPHHRSGTSSWGPMGPAVLDHFAGRDDVNLIFAPHVRLFDPPARHASAFRRWGGLDHVRIDLGSAASIDMTYALGADLYLGDLSSQVLEFVAKPRPCLFLNPRGRDWRGDPDFINWRLGPVVGDVTAMAEAIASADRWQPGYAEVHRAAFAAAFPETPDPAPLVGARAIAAFLRGEPVD